MLRPTYHAYRWWCGMVPYHTQYGSYGCHLCYAVYIDSQVDSSLDMPPYSELCLTTLAKSPSEMTREDIRHLTFF